MFWFILAKELGMSVREAQARIASDEFTEWREFWRLRRFGDRHEDYRMAIVAATVAASARMTDVKIEDYMPKYDEQPQDSPMSDEDIVVVWRAYVASHNAKVRAQHG